MVAVVRVMRPRQITEAYQEADKQRGIAGPGTDVAVGRSATTETPRGGTYVVAFGVLGIAIAVVWFIDNSGGLPASLKLADTANAFALFYVAAQAIERLLEPFTTIIHPIEKKEEEAEEALGAAATAGEAEAASEASNAAEKKAIATRTRNERAILFWAIAATAGVVVSAWFGLQFLGAILDAGSAARVPRIVDVAATGLVIGGGSKGLHDLITRISKPKEDESADS